MWLCQPQTSSLASGVNACFQPRGPQVLMQGGAPRSVGLSSIRSPRSMSVGAIDDWAKSQLLGRRGLPSSVATDARIALPLQELPAPSLLNPSNRARRLPKGHSFSWPSHCTACLHLNSNDARLQSMTLSVFRILEYARKGGKFRASSSIHMCRQAQTQTGSALTLVRSYRKPRQLTSRGLCTFL